MLLFSYVILVEVYFEVFAVLLGCTKPTAYMQAPKQTGLSPVLCVLNTKVW